MSLKKVSRIWATSFATASALEAEWDDPSVREMGLLDLAQPQFDGLFAEAEDAEASVKAETLAALVGDGVLVEVEDGHEFADGTEDEGHRPVWVLEPVVRREDGRTMRSWRLTGAEGPPYAVAVIQGAEVK